MDRPERGVSISGRIRWEQLVSGEKFRVLEEIDLLSSIYSLLEPMKKSKKIKFLKTVDIFRQSHPQFHPNPFIIQF